MKLVSTFILSALIIVGTKTFANDTLRVLFIGNSYTYVNDLPGLIRDFSASKGKTILFDSYAPGGYACSQHATDATCLAKIRQGNWDAVVLQEQSQMPTIPFYRDNFSAPGILALSDSITAYNPCARKLLFMTWGRRFGGQQCINGNCSPVFTDFNHRQDSLRSAYETFAGEVQATCAPVGMAWKKALEDPATILHSSDNSHPALTGSYLAACVFHAVLWRENSYGATFNAGLSFADVNRFQNIADSTVFYGISDWNLNLDIPLASFTTTVNGVDVSFTNTSTSRPGSTCTWDFGDGTISQDCNPIHSYSGPGIYNVLLMMNDCGQTDSVWAQVVTNPTGFDESVWSGDSFKVYPNPAKGYCKIITRISSDHSTKVIGIDGSLQKHFIWNGNERLLNLEGTPPGMYWIELDDASRKPIIVQ
ncbi:MAG: PKD domain-containing protein [Bacteroidota bacterium]